MSDDQKVIDRLYDWLKEAAEVRWGADDEGSMLVVPHYSEGPQAFATELLSARRRQDRIEELLRDAKRVQAHLKRRQSEKDDEFNDKMDRALAEGSITAREFSTGMERRADASLKSFEEKRAARQSQRALAVAEEVVTALSDIHWGLNGWRNDMRDILRSFVLESNLER